MNYIILYCIILYYIYCMYGRPRFFPMVDPLTASVPLAAQGLGQPAPPPGDDAHPGIEAPHGQKKPWSLDDKRWENRDFTTDTTGKLKFHWAKYGKIVISLRKIWENLDFTRQNVGKLVISQGNSLGKIWENRDLTRENTGKS